MPSNFPNHSLYPAIAFLAVKLILEHADGFTTRYAHLQSVAVKQGSLIQQGDYLGTTGNTGKSTGPHLHFETMRNGDKIDPLKLLLITQK
jgi:murein DD-endopeptidase MepM/ murein hydrolase activator NlpD